MVYSFLYVVYDVLYYGTPPPPGVDFRTGLLNEDGANTKLNDTCSDTQLTTRLIDISNASH